MSIIEFISLGPGAAEYVALGTLRLLREAEKIYCFAANGVSHATDIIASLDRHLSTLEAEQMQSKTIRINVPMSKDRSLANKVYDDLAETLRQDSVDGRKVVVATEGDTGIFATTHYVMDRLVEMNIPCHQTPGIPSFIAAASIAGLHLVKLQERLIIIPGNTTAEEIERLTDAGCNLVIMKLSMAHAAVSEVMNRRTDLQFHYFENIGMPTQQYRLLTTPPDSFPYFSLMIIPCSNR